VVLFGLLLGIVIGVVIGYLFARSRQADLVGRARAAEEKTRIIEGQLPERFQALSAQALDASSARFLETLARVEEQLRESDRARVQSHAALAEQVVIARQTSEQLRDQTQALVTALRRPEARGRWGELQLRRVVELAGLAERCDFDEQVHVDCPDGVFRPDLVVRLPGGRSVVVDAKVSLTAYLEAAECTGDTQRRERLRAHARRLRAHVDELADKQYWARVAGSPEFVVLFLPGEAFLAPALEHDPDLLEHAMTSRVLIATPTTLIAMLRTVAWGWQQESLTTHAREVFELGRELYGRLSTMGEHVDRLGRSLSRAVSDYNAATASLETRVLVSARRLHHLGVVSEDLPAPRGISVAARPATAPELITEPSAAYD
jgi:DNA recombination protein RmuC